MKKSVRSWGIGMVRRLAAVFLCAAMVLSLIGPQKVKAASGVKRHIVLVLDTSGASNFYNSDMSVLLYSADSPNAQVKEAALKFAEFLETSSDDVYVSIVSYGTEAGLVCDFTNNYTSLKSSIRTAGSVGGRKNMTEGLAIAKSQLDTVANETSIKSVILVSPGLCDVGETVTNGHWSTSSVGGNWMNADTRVPFVYCCNAAYQKAEAIKATGAKIYGIGMMKMMKDCPDSVKAPAQLFQNVLRDISSEGCYYPVYEVENFVFTFGQMTQEIVAGSKGKFTYASINDGEYSADYYFEDDYFATPATEYNPSLATMSMCFAMSAFASERTSDVTLKSMNAKALLRDCGFEDIQANDDFQSVPNVDTMGVVIGHKEIKTDGDEFTLIALATRGAGYENEWAGNFKVGLSGNHAGFTTAKNVALNFLNSYIAKNSKNFKGKVKLWMTGFSRAAATVNLLAGEITKAGKIGANNQISVAKDDIYAYCFETPMGLSGYVQSKAEAQKYTNIHNIVNPNDFVPKVAMSGWNFLRYGVDEPVIPSMATDAHYNTKVAKMMSYYSSIGGKTIKDSIAFLSDYETHEADVLAGIYAKGKQIFCSNIHSGPRDVSGMARLQAKIDEWDDPNGIQQITLRRDYLSGKTSSTVNGITVYFQECPGYGMFDNAYDFRLGLNEIRRIRLNYYAGPTDYGILTDKVSKIDLFHLRSYGGSISSVKGLWNLWQNIKAYTPDYSITQGEALDDILSRLTTKLTRSIYFDKVQNGVVAVLREWFRTNSYFANHEFKDFKMYDAIGGWTELAGLAISMLTTKNVTDNAESIYENFLEYLQKEQRVNVHMGLSSAELDKLKEGIKVLVQALADIAVDQRVTEEIVSLGVGFETIAMAHYPELCFSWLRSQDPNYGPGNKKVYSPTAQRIIYINCPV